MAVLVALAPCVRAQETPQRHMTAVVTFTNGRAYVYSVDSGGARRVVVQATATTTDTVLGHPRGGVWTAPAEQIELHALSVSRALDALEADAPPITFTLEWAAGPVRTAVIRCTKTTGCAVTITNRTATGATRAGSWTASPRLSLATVRQIVRALLHAVRHDDPAVFTWPDSQGGTP